MLLRYEEIIKLSASNFSYDGKIKPSRILDIFQSIATEHAEQIGAGFRALLDKDLIWVLLKIRYDVIKPIPFMATVKAVTSPRPKSKLGYVRDYFIYSLDGELLVKGSSFWCLASYSTRKLSRPVFEYDGEYNIQVAYNDDFERLKPIQFETPDYSHKINILDIDRNQHTNNINYVDFAICGLNRLVDIKSFSIVYNNETKLNDIISIGYQLENDCIYTTGKVDGKDAFTIKMKI